jgi:lysophospholipase L1-like esterase
LKRPGPRSLVVGACIVALLLFEGGLRLFAPLEDPFWRERSVEIESYIPRRHEPDFRLEIEPEPGLPGVAGRRVFETNGQGFVGPAIDRQPRPNEKRVFLFGGSTMECVVVGNEHNPARLVADRLETATSTVKWNVQNTAHSGDVSFDHIAMLVHRALHFRPDVVVMLVGANDVNASLRSADYSHGAPKRRHFDLKTVFRLTSTELHVGRLLVGTLTNAPLRFATRDSATRTKYRATAARCRANETKPYDASQLALASFERNLRTFVASAQANGAQVVLATQPHALQVEALDAWHWFGCSGQGRYAKADLVDAMHRINEVTRRVASETNATLVDLAAASMTAEHFYDTIHYNDAGAAFISDKVAEAIQR